MDRQQHIEKLEQRKTKLADDVQRLTLNSEKAARDTGRQAKLTASRTRENARVMARELTSDAKEVVTQAGDDTREAAVHGVKSAGAKAAAYPRRAVQEKPLVTFGVAAGAGFLLSLLIASRRQRRSEDARIGVVGLRPYAGDEDFPY